jgi:uncharacterized protein YbjT (DUF2867 family)
MYVITGATGNTGKPITLALLAAGKKVRVISRDPAKAKELTDKGAELFVGDPSNEVVLAKAFEGATAVYAMIALEWNTPDYFAHQKKHADAIASALGRAKVRYVVSLSSVGAHLEKESGVVYGLRYMEQKFNGIAGLNALHLRPTYFMENVLGQIGVVKQMGIMGSPVKGDLSMNMIATKDIAAYASRRLLALDFSGHSVQYLLGQRDVTYSEVAKVVGTAIGKPDLKYVESTYEDFARGLMQVGASQSLAENMNTFIKALNAGKVLEDARRTGDTTTPTGIEEFAGTFAHIFNMK